MENTTLKSNFPLSIHCNVIAFDRMRRPGSGSILSSKFSNSLILTNQGDGGAKVIWIQAVSSVLNVRRGGSSPLQLSFILEHPPSREMILLLFYSCDKKDLQSLNENEIIKDSVLLGQIFVPISTLNLNQKNRFTFFIENNLTSMYNTSYEEATTVFKKACEKNSGHLKVSANFWVSDEEVLTTEKGKIVSDNLNNFTSTGPQKTLNPNLYQSVNSVSLSQLKKPATTGSYLYTPSYAEYDVSPQDSASNLNGRTGMNDLDYEFSNYETTYNYDVPHDYVKVAKAHKNMSKIWRIDAIDKLYSKIQSHEEVITLLLVINAWRTLSHERFIVNQLSKTLSPLIPDGLQIESLEGLSHIVQDTNSTILNLKAQCEKANSTNDSLMQKYKTLKEKHKKNKEIITQQQQDHITDMKSLFESLNNKCGNILFDKPLKSTSKSTSSGYAHSYEGTRMNQEYEETISMTKESNSTSPSSTTHYSFLKEKSLGVPLPEFRPRELNNTKVLTKTEEKNDDSSKKNPTKYPSNLTRSPSFLTRLTMSVKRV